MSFLWNQIRAAQGRWILGLSAVPFLVLATAEGQYPGHIDKNKATQAPEPRATAVLEWTGQPGKPSASRIVPIAVFDGQTYQPGGL